MRYPVAMDRPPLSLALVAILIAACSGDDPSPAPKPPRAVDREKPPEVDQPVADGSSGIRGRLDHRLVHEKAPAVVYIERIEGRTFEPPAEDAVVDQVESVFIPRVQGVLVGSTVEFVNSDGIRHNVQEDAEDPAFDLNFRPRQTEEVVLDEPGVIRLICRFHSDMEAWLVVVETPWFATTGPDGSFALPGVPPGTYRLTFWHEQLESRTIEVIVVEGRSTEAVFELPE